MKMGAATFIHLPKGLCCLSSRYCPGNVISSTKYDTVSVHDRIIYLARVRHFSLSLPRGSRGRAPLATDAMKRSQKAGKANRLSPIFQPAADGFSLVTARGDMELRGTIG